MATNVNWKLDTIHYTLPMYIYTVTYKYISGLYSHVTIRTVTKYPPYLSYVLQRNYLAGNITALYSELQGILRFSFSDNLKR